MKSILSLVLPLLSLPLAPEAIAQQVDRASSRLSSLEERARAVLLKVFNAREDWVSIHAAEIMVETGRHDGLRDAMMRRMDGFEKAGTRVGAWRVMSMMLERAERNEWNHKLEQVLLDSAAVDRLQALESLAKVKHRLTGPALVIARGLTRELADSDLVVLPLWAMAAGGDPRVLESLVGLLKSADVATRRRAAYALRRLSPESSALRSAVLEALEREPADTIAYPYLLCTALDLELDPMKIAGWCKVLRTVASTAAPKVRFEALQVLAKYYRSEDVESLLPQLEDPDGDVRAGVALALLRIVERNGSPTRL